MLKRYLLVFLLILFLVYVGYFGSSDAQTTNQSTAAEGGFFKYIEATKSFLKKAFAQTLTSAKKIFQWLKENLWVKIKEWLKYRKEALKIGLEEEKEELGQGLKQTLLGLWGKLKDLIKSE